MEMTELMGRARSQLAEVTGLKPETAIGASKTEDGWHVDVEMLELARIPAGSDVLGTYRALLDEDGTLLKFERTRMRLRAETTDREEAA